MKMFIVYGKTPPKFGENNVTLPLDVDRPCFKPGFCQSNAVNLRTKTRVLSFEPVFWNNSLYLTHFFVTYCLFALKTKPSRLVSGIHILSWLVTKIQN